VRMLQRCECAAMFSCSTSPLAAKMLSVALAVSLEHNAASFYYEFSTVFFSEVVCCVVLDGCSVAVCLKLQRGCLCESVADVLHRCVYDAKHSAKK
jgi:hypothetical protein